MVTPEPSMNRIGVVTPPAGGSGRRLKASSPLTQAYLLLVLSELSAALDGRGPTALEVAVQKTKPSSDTPLNSTTRLLTALRRITTSTQ